VARMRRDLALPALAALLVERAIAP
jgi:hypothetical protein